MREKLGRLGRRLLQLEKETRYPAHPPSSPAEAYVADVGTWKCFVGWDRDLVGIHITIASYYWLKVVTSPLAKCGAIHCVVASHWQLVNGCYTLYWNVF